MGTAIQFRRHPNQKLKNLSSKKVQKLPAVGEVDEEHPGELELATMVRKIPNQQLLLLQPGLVRGLAENSDEM